MGLDKSSFSEHLLDNGTAKYTVEWISSQPRAYAGPVGCLVDGKLFWFTRLSHLFIKPKGIDKEEIQRLLESVDQPSSPRVRVPSETLAEQILYIPRCVKEYFARMSGKFGWRYTAAVVAVYGVQEGWGQAWSNIATYWFLLDPKPKGLGWSNTRYTMALQFANIPWQMKAVFGMVSDSFPLWGRSRSPYIVLAAVLGVGAFAALSLEMARGVLAVSVLLLIMNLAQGVPDVMVDASVAENIKRFPSYSTDLQTLCWGSYFLFSCVMVEPGAIIQKEYGWKVLYGTLVATCLVVLYPGMMNWLKDHEVPAQEQQQSLGSGTVSGRRGFWHNLSDPARGPVFKLAIFVSACALAQGFVGYAMVSDLQVGLVGVATLLVMCFGIWHWASQVSITLARATLMIFLVGAVQPNTAILTVWSKETNDPGDTECGSAEAVPGSMEADWYQNKWCHQCAPGRNYLEQHLPRPCFDAPFLGVVAIVANVFGLLGTVLYNQYFSGWSYRRSFTLAQLLFVLFGFTDLIWVQRLNVRWGISDKLFVVGQELIFPTIGRLSTMPCLVLAAQLCPDHVEATLYALIMGVSNMSFSTGNYIGVGLVAIVDSYSPDFDHLAMFIALRNMFACLPLLIIALLSPNGNPKLGPDELRAVNGEMPLVSLLKPRTGYGTYSDSSVHTPIGENALSTSDNMGALRLGIKVPKQNIFAPEEN